MHHMRAHVCVRMCVWVWAHEYPHGTCGPFLPAWTVCGSAHRRSPRRRRSTKILQCGTPRRSLRCAGYAPLSLAARHGTRSAGVRCRAACCAWRHRRCAVCANFQVLACADFRVYAKLLEEKMVYICLDVDVDIGIDIDIDRYMITYDHLHLLIHLGLRSPKAKHCTYSTLKLPPYHRPILIMTTCIYLHFIGPNFGSLVRCVMHHIGAHVCMCVGGCAWGHTYPRRTCDRVVWPSGFQLCVGLQREHRRVEHRVCVEHGQCERRLGRRAQRGGLPLSVVVRCGAAVVCGGAADALVI